MAGWLHEINWLMIVMVAIGVFFGTEIRRHGVVAEGGIYSFLPLRMHRLLMLSMILSAELIIESARIALKTPSAFHVWILFFATAAAFILFAAFAGLELAQAKRALRAAHAGGGKSRD